MTIGYSQIHQSTEKYESTTHAVFEIVCQGQTIGGRNFPQRQSKSNILQYNLFYSNLMLSPDFVLIFV